MWLFLMPVLNGPIKTLGTFSDDTQSNKLHANFNGNIRFQDLYSFGPFLPSTVHLQFQNSCCLLLEATATSFSIHEPLQITRKNTDCFHRRQCLRWTQKWGKDDPVALAWWHWRAMWQGPPRTCPSASKEHPDKSRQTIAIEPFDQQILVLLWLSYILKLLDLTSLKSECLF